MVLKHDKKELTYLKILKAQIHEQIGRGNRPFVLNRNANASVFVDWRAEWLSWE